MTVGFERTIFSADYMPSRSRQAGTKGRALRGQEVHPMSGRGGSAGAWRGLSARQSEFFARPEHVQSPEIVGQAHQGPFRGHLFEAAQQELAEDPSGSAEA